jgi:hypothetical protein
MEEELGNNYPGRPVRFFQLPCLRCSQSPQNDLISWLLDVAEGEERTVPALVQRILVINFGAVHTSANVGRSWYHRCQGKLTFCQTFTHALFNLAAFPSSVEEMREEADRIVEEEGWSKVSVAKMHKIDSFLRESQRYSGNSISAFPIIHSDP